MRGVACTLTGVTFTTEFSKRTRPLYDYANYLSAKDKGRYPWLKMAVAIFPVLNRKKKNAPKRV